MRKIRSQVLRWLTWMLTFQCILLLMLSSFLDLTIRGAAPVLNSDNDQVNIGTAAEYALFEKVLTVRYGHVSLELNFPYKRVYFPDFSYSLLGLSARSYKTDLRLTVKLHPDYGTVRRLEFRVPILMLYVPPFVVLGLLLWTGPIRTRIRKSKGLCLKCAYDLRGLPGHICPECERDGSARE